MAEQYLYIPTELTQISSALGRLFEGGSSGAAASQSNLIIAAAPGERIEDLEVIVDMIAAVHPSRIFIIGLIESGAKIEAGVTARCHLVSGSDPVCSEVVRLAVPTGRLDALPSVLRGAFLTGAPIELVAHSARLDRELLTCLTGLAETVLYDLREFESNLDDGFSFSDTQLRAIDLEWFRLGVWRDELRAIFLRPLLSGRIDEIRRIEVRYAPRRDGGAPVGALLMLGWLLQRLGAEPLAFGAAGFECRSPAGASIVAAIVLDPSSARVGVNGIAVHFVDAEPRIEVERGAGALQSAVTVGDRLRSNRALEDESQAAVLQRYFVHGGSTAHYLDALKIARMLEGLRCGFTAR